MAHAAWAQVFAMEPVSKPSCGVLLGAALNLFISAAGAGLLSFPLVCVQQGYLLCVIFTAACGWVNWFTLRILGEFASAGAAQLGASHVGTLDALSAAVFPAGSTSNARMYAAASFAVLVGCAGSLVGFLILIGDITSPLLQLIACPGAGCTVLSYRGTSVFAFALFVALPLSSYTKLHGLRNSSALAAATVLSVTTLLVSRLFLSEHSTPSLGSNGVVPILLTLPIEVFALGAAVQIIF